MKPVFQFLILLTMVVSLPGMATSTTVVDQNQTQMAKELSASELQKKADHYFKIYPDQEELVITTDGNVFFKKNEGLARDHARKHDLKVKSFQKKAPRAKASGKDREKGKDPDDGPKKEVTITKPDNPKEAVEVTDTNPATLSTEQLDTLISELTQADILDWKGNGYYRGDKKIADTKAGLRKILADYPGIRKEYLALVEQVQESQRT